MEISVNASLVESYRRELNGFWGIRPALWGDEIDERLDPRERKEWHYFMRKLDQKDSRAAVRFYEWLSTRRRAAAIHSYKWAEILVSGTWAAAAVAALDPLVTVDIGCNVGYWTTWMAAQRPVLGIDRSKPAIGLARAAAKELNRPGASFAVADFGADRITDAGADCVVSLQGLQEALAVGNFAPFSDAASHIRDGGHLVAVEGWIPDRDATEAFDHALHDAGLSVVSIAECGGLGFGEATFHHLGIIAVKDHARRGSVASYRDGDGWNALCAWVDTQPQSDWSRHNTAYFSAAGGNTTRAVG